MKKEILKTSEEWYKIYREEGGNIILLDADGWDREYFQQSWFGQQISRDKFMRRLNKSTVTFNKKSQ